MTSATIPTSTSGIRLRLPVSDKPGYFLVDYDYGNGGGGFPLDSIVGERRVGFGFCHSEANKETNPTCSQWGPQTLSIYCPPYDYQYASSQTDRYGASTANLCKNWLNKGGPRATDAAAVAATASPEGNRFLRTNLAEIAPPRYSQK